jgi:hypothetical protein
VTRNVVKNREEKESLYYNLDGHHHPRHKSIASTFGSKDFE